MPTDPPPTTRALPDRPNIRHLKGQARDLLKTGVAKSLTAAHFKIARLYGFASWPKLKAHVESLEEIGQLKRAIDGNEVQRVKTMMTRNPALHRAPLGYGKTGSLTWVAECRVPSEPPSSLRLAMTTWMIQNGSDVHQGGDMPLMRASLTGDRIPMMEVLVSNGADVNAAAKGNFPIIFAPCETLEPQALRWLLEHGADPNVVNPNGRVHETALDYVIATYVRSSEQLSACIEILLAAGGVTRYDVPAVLDLLRAHLDSLAERLDADPSLLNRQFPELDFGMSGGRTLTLTGATLLHVAAEYGNVEAARLLLDRGAHVDARAIVDNNGVGGQTAIFHAVTQGQGSDQGVLVARLLLDRGADLSVRARLPGDYERPGEVVECTPLGYALLFPGAQSKTVTLLRERGAPE